MDTNENKIIIEERDRTIILKINNPEKKNVLTQEIRETLWDILLEKENSDHKTLVFMGEGENFSSGADIKKLISLEKETVTQYTTYVREFLNYLKNYPKITIGAVKGFAIGGGLELLLCLDLVYSGKSAKFGQTELNVGIIPGGGATQRLQDVIGIRMAKEMIYTGKIITSDEAIRMRLINDVFPDEDLLEETLKIARKINEKNTSSLISSKLAINSRMSDELKHLHLESELYKKILISEDAKEGLSAFLEKRKPAYSDHGSSGPQLSK